MKFEDLENLWAGQPVPNSGAINPAELLRSFQPELRRRRRMYGYAIFWISFNLVLFVLLTVVNYRHAPPARPVSHWLYFALELAWLIFILATVLRGARRHRTLLHQRSDTIRSATTLALASLEDEMKGYRTATLWPVLLVSIGLFGYALANGIAEYGWWDFGLPFSVMTVGLAAVCGLVFGRHYRVNLKPERDRLKTLLQQLD